MIATNPPSPDVAREVARILLRLGAVAIDVQHPFVYASGTESPIYCDNRLLISYPDEREYVVEAIRQRIDEQVGAEGIDVVAGTATAGIPFAAWVSALLRKPMIYVRSTPKEHGRGRQVEGRIDAGRRVVVIEDLVTTGGSSLQTVEAIRREGGVVSHCFAIFTYELVRAWEAFERHGVTLAPLSTISTLLEVAIEDGQIEPDDRRRVLAWRDSLQPR